MDMANTKITTEDEIKKTTEVNIKIIPYDIVTINVKLKVEAGDIIDTEFERERTLHFRLENGYAVFEEINAKVPLDKLAEFIDAAVADVTKKLEEEAKDWIEVFRQYAKLAKKYSVVVVE
jgi:hypothetical protein